MVGLNDRLTNDEQNWLLNEAYVGIPVPKITRDVVPCSLMTSRLIQNKESDRLLRVLFDSGASHTLIHASALPLNTHLFSLPQEEQCQTVAGTFTSTKMVRLRDI